MTDPILPSSTLHTVAVFCGSNFGRTDAYRSGAKQLGQTLARRGIELVYGGTDKGLMGVVANAVLDGGGKAYGVINRGLYERGHLHPRLAHYEIVPEMRTRKARMGELSGAFIALPGGFGTFEEFFEAATLTQLGEQVRPCGALNVGGFFDPMLAMLDHAVEEGFLKAVHRNMLVIESEPEALLDRLLCWESPQVTKWINQPGA